MTRNSETNRCQQERILNNSDISRGFSWWLFVSSTPPLDRGTEHAWISRAESNVREYHGYIMDGIMNRRRSGTPGCTNIFMRVESGTKLQWDITKFLGEGKIETVKTRGQVGRLEFILEKANTASSGIYYSCPDTRHHFSILSPLSVLRNANGASAIRRPSRRVVPPREVFSKYP